MFFVTGVWYQVFHVARDNCFKTSTIKFEQNCFKKPLETQVLKSWDAMYHHDCSPRFFLRGAI